MDFFDIPLCPNVTIQFLSSSAITWDDGCPLPIYFLCYRLYLVNHVTLLADNGLAEHLNTGLDGSCTGRAGYCVNVCIDKNGIIQL